MSYNICMTPLEDILTYYLNYLGLYSMTFVTNKTMIFQSKSKINQRILRNKMFVRLPD
jgi:hypothetical protein